MILTVTNCLIQNQHRDPFRQLRSLKEIILLCIFDKGFQDFLV